MIRVRANARGCGGARRVASTRFADAEHLVLSSAIARLHWLNHAVEWVVFACVSERDGAFVESDDDERVAHGRGGAGCGCVDA